MKRFSYATRLSFAMGALALALAPSLALAVGFQGGDAVTVAKGTTHHGTLYAAGQNLTVDGDVDGDFICAGNTVTINGAVHGDVLCAGQTITVNGPVDGNVRVAGQTVTLNNQTARNVSAAAQTFELGPASKTAGDVALLGQTAVVHSPVGRDLYGVVNSLTLNGPVTGNVDTQVQDLSLGQDAHVTGSMTYTSDKTLNVSADKVDGGITHHTPPQHQQATQSPRDEAIAWIMDRLYWIVATIVIMLLLAWVAPRSLRRFSDTMIQRPGASIGWGALILFAGPIGLIALLFTVVGIPLAILLGLAYVLAIALSGALISIVVGRWIVSRTDWNHDSLPLMVLIGVPVTLIVLALPIVGALLSLVATFWVLGGLTARLRPPRATKD